MQHALSSLCVNADAQTQPCGQRFVCSLGHTVATLLVERAVHWRGYPPGHVWARTAQMYICEAFLVDKVYRAVPDQKMLPGQVRLCYSSVDDNRAA
jgi:hypothetical protein